MSALLLMFHWEYVGPENEMVCWESLQVSSGPILMQVLYHVFPACEIMIILTIITHCYILLFLSSYNLMCKDILKNKWNA